MAFGKNKNKEPDVKPPSAFEVGKSGTVEEFTAANKEAFDLQSGARQEELLKGAVSAFLEGNPENVQEILKNPDSFKIFCSWPNPNRDMATEALFEVTKDSGDPVSIIDLALLNVPEDDKKKRLQNRLYNAIQFGVGDEPFVENLIKAGAPANAETDEGFAGYILARAIDKSRSPAIIEALYKGGASFKDALFLMQTKNWNEETIKRLKVYREKVTGEPAAIEVTPETLQQIREQMVELTKRFDALTPDASQQLKEQMTELTRQVGGLTEEVKDMKSVVAEPVGTKLKKMFATPGQ